MESKEMQQHRATTEVDGFAWASLITGSISLFHADRLLYPNGGEYFLLSLVTPAAGIATAFLAYRRVQQGSRMRGREQALAGAVLSLVSVTIVVLTKLFVY